MIKVMREVIKASKIRTVCIYGVILVGFAKLGCLILAPAEWPGHTPADVAIIASSFGLAMIAFFPPAPLRRTHHMVFYVAFALLGIEQLIWHIVVLYSEMKTPWWILALNAILLFVMFGALFLGEEILKYRLRMALIMLIFVAIPALIYIFVR